MKISSSLCFQSQIVKNRVLINFEKSVLSRFYDQNYDADNWHIYGWEWTDEYAKWWINGKLVNILYKNQSRRPELWPDENMYIILNNGVRAAAPASDTSTIWPNQLEIDYIELYQKN